MTCVLGEIGAGASISVDITVTVDEAFCGSIVNSADISASNETGGATENNSSNDVTNTVDCGEATPPVSRSPRPPMPTGSWRRVTTSTTRSR